MGLGLPGLFSQLGDLLLSGLQGADEFFQHALGASDPLPDLRAGDLGSGGVFHHIEDRHAAVACEP